MYLETHCNIGSKRALTIGVLDRVTQLFTYLLTHKLFSSCIRRYLVSMNDRTRCRPNGTQPYWPAVQCRPHDRPRVWPAGSGIDHDRRRPSKQYWPIRRASKCPYSLLLGWKVRWTHDMLPSGEWRWVCRRERRIDIRQFTLRFPLWTLPKRDRIN